MSKTPQVGASPPPNLLHRVADHFKADPRQTEPFDVFAGIPVGANPPEMVEVRGADQRRVGGAMGAGILATAANVGALSAAPALVLPGVAGKVGRPAAKTAVQAARLVAALVGGVVGEGVGSLLNLAGVHFTVSQQTADDARVFSLRGAMKSAPHLLYSHHAKLSDEQKTRIKELLQPGDVLLANFDAPSFQIPLKALGDSGAWNHTALFVGTAGSPTDEPSVVEMHKGKTRESSIDRFLHRYHHVMIIRPRYSSPEAVDKTIQDGIDGLGKGYDWTFRLGNQDKTYCMAYNQGSIEAGDPNIHIQPTQVAGKAVLTPGDFFNSPDMEPIYSTGSRFGPMFSGVVT